MYLILNSQKLIVEICKHPCYVVRQSNGVVVLSDAEHADAIYSNDTDTFWQTQAVGYLCDSHTMVEVEEVPKEVIAQYYFYHAGAFYTTENKLQALHTRTDADKMVIDHEYRLTIIETLAQ